MEDKKVDVSGDLAALQDAWKVAEMPPTFVSEVPDGTYQVSLKMPSIGRAKNSNRLQITWQLQIASGALKNQIISKYDGLNPEQLGYVKQALKKLGLPNIQSPAQLPLVLEKAEGILCEVVVKTKGEFQNIFFGKLLDPSALAAQRNML